MIKETIQDAEKRMRSAIDALEEDLAGVRTGRASPALIEKLQVNYYGSPVPLHSASKHQCAGNAPAAGAPFRRRRGQGH